MKRNSQIKRKTPLASKAPIARKREKRQPVQKGRRKAQKDHRFRSQAYLSFVRALPCSACSTCSVPRDAHHVIGLGWGLSGMGLTAPDSFVMPLCRACHQDIHGSPELQRYQPGWLRHTIARGVREFGGDIGQALREAWAYIEAREAA